MQINYTVHSVEKADIETLANVNGSSMVVKVPGLVVELVSDSGDMGHTFRILPTNMDEALALYTVGGRILSTHSAA